MKQKQMFFWNSLAFSMIQQILPILSLVPLPFLKPAWTSGLENFEHYYTSVWDECNCAVVWAFFGIAFLRDQNENWLFPDLWPLLSLPDLCPIVIYRNIIVFRKCTLRYLKISLHDVYSLFSNSSGKNTAVFLCTRVCERGKEKVRADVQNIDIWGILLKVFGWFFQLFNQAEIAAVA